MTTAARVHVQARKRRKPRLCRRRPVALALLLCLGASPVALHSDMGRADAALTDATRARIERGIGRLLVPAIRYRDGYARHYDEQCSATLVADAPQRESTLLLSAWHCIEDYRDLSRDLVFVAGDGRHYPVTVVASGGGMRSDWLLLRLAEALPGPLPLGAVDRRSTPALILAGYPRSASVASALALRTACTITGADGADLSSDCVLTRGASGGAAIDVSGAPRYLGVISRGDGQSQSIFVPVGRFYEHVRGHLARAAERAAPP